MKCLVINLDRSVDRLTQVRSEFVKVGVPFERISAVDASKEPSHFPAARHLTGPEIACFLSHRECWQIIAAGPDEYGAIFEDDVVLSGDARPFLSDDSWVPRDADIVKIETLFGKVRVARIASIGAGHSIARLVGEHLGTAGYVISRDASRRLLLRTKHLDDPVDLTLFSPRSMTCALNTTYQMTPALCVQSRLLGKESGPTLIQLAPHHRKGMLARIRGELTRVLAHCETEPGGELREWICV